MNTVFLLMAEFESPVLNIDDVAPKYFNMSDPRTYKQAAVNNQLPIAFFRASKSQKATWLCHIQDLANLIDTQRQAANDEFERSNS